MRLSFLLTGLVGVAISAIGQITADDSPHSRNQIDRPALLREAHDLASQIVLEQRAVILSRVAHGAGILGMIEAKSWCQELFDLAANLKPEEREGVEESAATAMSKTDPAAALAMLLAVEPAPPPEVMGHLLVPFHHNVPEPRTTSTIFSGYFEHYGVAGLPELERAAQQLATHGDYPFSAWGKILPKLQATDSRNVPDLMKQILNGAAIAAYQADLAQDDLMQFLEESSGALPASMKRDLVQIAVKRILDGSQKDSNDSDAKYNISMGPKSAKFTNSADATLYRYLATIRTADPELAESLLKTRPELAAAPPAEAGACCGGYTTMYMSVSARSESDSGFVSSAKASEFTTPSAPPAWREPAAFARERQVASVMEKSSSDPKAAIAAANALSDDGARAKAYAQLASQHGCDPSAATELLAKASRLCTKQDDETQMDCLLDIASASLTRNDPTTYGDALTQFLQLAARAPKQGRNLSLTFQFRWEVLARGMDSYPQLTLAAIRATPDMSLRAQYLADAAVAKAPGRREYGEILMEMY